MRSGHSPVNSGQGGDNRWFINLRCNGPSAQETPRTMTLASAPAAPADTHPHQTMVDTAAYAAHAAEVEALRGALMDSRARWRDLVGLAADIAFETDAFGRFVFISPDPALGWPAATLLGQPAELLLADAGGGGGFNPVRPTVATRRRRAWLRRPDAPPVCMNFAAAPLLDSENRIVGARGVGQDVSEQEGQEDAMAAALRRTELVDHILWRMRQEVLAPRMMQAALESLATAMGLEGCVIVDLLGDGVQASVLHQYGTQVPEVMHTAMTLLEQGRPEPTGALASDGRNVLVCPSHTRFGEQVGLAFWRAPGARAWDADEIMLASSATAIVRFVLEHESIQREMARQARTDPLTGLLNRRAFLEEMARRVDRLEREGLPGTLMFVDLDNFKSLNDRRGHDAGDEALCITAALLRETVRPSDLVARLGGDEFALWMDGADDLTAAERADALCLGAPAAFADITGELDGQAPEISISMSIGIATRWPGHGEDIDTVMHRADQAMYQVKRAGRGHWRVSHREGE